MPHDSDATTRELEAAAELLEQSGDYRVLRRLQQKDVFITESKGPLRSGVVLDTETTGRNTEEDKVIELALVKFDYEPDTARIVAITGVYSALEDPGMPIPPETIAIHGITNDMVAGKALDDVAIASFMNGVDIVIAHNASFDRAFIERRLPLFMDVAWGCSHVQVPWAAEGFGGSKLEFLAWSSGFFYDAHRSEVDCRALLELLRKPLPNSHTLPFRYLLDAAAEPSLRLWATGSPFDSKDALKDREYRWHVERRVWHKVVAKSVAREETEWLKEHVYRHRPAQIDVEVLDAKILFSNRSGPRKSKVI
jgi:DNA polymerase-3 subunit epsilon